MSKLKFFVSESTNPHLNLATEEWIFHHLEAATQVLFLWRNDNTVVIGRNQNPWAECNLKKMQAEHVTLARRTTGGGAVFHDLGNTNFTFLSPRENYVRANNNEIILRALRKFGIQGEASGRNDLLAEAGDGPRKFSGSAFREKKDRAFHHGTLLLNANLGRLGELLTPNPKKLQAKGKESVRARVVNLQELNPAINHESLCPVLIEEFAAFYGGAKPEDVEYEVLNMQTLQQIPLLAEHYKQMSSWDWLYGNTLEFTQRIEEYVSLGFFDFQFKVNEGVIQDLHVFSDSLYPQLIERITLLLKGKPYTQEGVRKVFGQLRSEFEFAAGELVELQNKLIDQIEI